MSFVVEQFNEMCQANLTATRQLTSILFDGTEDMLRATIQTSRGLYDADVAQSNANVVPSIDGVIDWCNKYQNNAQLMLNVIQNYFEETAKAHIKAVHIIHDQIAAAGNSWSQAADRQLKSSDDQCLQTKTAPETSKPEQVAV